MLSMPPATTIAPEPAAIRSWANIAAFMPEPHILLMVVQPTWSGMPAPMAAWRAGAWPWPAERMLPMITSSTSRASTPARESAASIAAEPSSGARASFSAP